MEIPFKEPWPSPFSHLLKFLISLPEGIVDFCFAGVCRFSGKRHWEFKERLGTHKPRWPWVSILGENR